MYSRKLYKTSNYSDLNLETLDPPWIEIGQCNYRHASPPARSQSWGLVDVQVDFTGLAILTRQGTARTPLVSRALTNLDPRLLVVHPCFRDKLTQQLFKIDDLLRPGWTRPHMPWLSGSQQRSRARDACRRQLGEPWPIGWMNGNLNQQSRERRQQSPLRLRFRVTQGCWIQHAPSRQSPSWLFRRSLAVRRRSINQPSPINVNVKCIANHRYLPPLVCSGCAINPLYGLLV